MPAAEVQGLPVTLMPSFLEIPDIQLCDTDDAKDSVGHRVWIFFLFGAEKNISQAVRARDQSGEHKSNAHKTSVTSSIVPATRDNLHFLSERQFFPVSMMLVLKTDLWCRRSARQRGARPPNPHGPDGRSVWSNGDLV